jgi:hypothetical protein
MTRLKLGPIRDDKPVRLTIVLPAELAELLRAYAQAVGSGNPGKPVTPECIVPPILDRFIRTDRVHADAPAFCRPSAAAGGVGSGEAELILSPA